MTAARRLQIVFGLMLTFGVEAFLPLGQWRIAHGGPGQPQLVNGLPLLQGFIRQKGK